MLQSFEIHQQAHCVMQAWVANSTFYYSCQSSLSGRIQCGAGSLRRQRGAPLMAGCVGMAPRGQCQWSGRSDRIGNTL